MSDETGRVFDRSRDDAACALESAACLLRASPRPARTTSTREREILVGRQVRDLVAWARQSGCLISPAACAQAERGGEEHRVWLDEECQRYFKTTHPGRFGFVVMLGPGGRLGMVDATPLEYLDRLQLQNRVFGDEVRLEGVTWVDGGVVVVTSQPNVVGTAATEAEILTFMQSQRFQPLPGIHLGKPGALAFYRDLDDVAAFDAHRGNFVKDQNGVILPIDLILIGADSRLQAALSAPAD